MAENRYLHPDVLDKGLEHLKNNGNKLVLVNDKPTTYLQATDTFMLMEVALDSADFIIDDGSVDGRVITVSGKNDVPVTNSGTVSHFAIVDTVNEELLLVTPCIHLEVAAGGSENTNEFAWTARAPTAP